jgi:hypothetical protein
LKTHFATTDGLRDDDDDDEADLMRELEKIKRERAEQRAKEVLFPLANSNLGSPDVLTGRRKQKRPLKKRNKENSILPVATRSSIPRTSMSRDGTIFDLPLTSFATILTGFQMGR